VSFVFGSKCNYKTDIELYLKGLKYLSSDFAQEDSGGNVCYGHLYISKKENKNVRIDYDESIHQRIFIKDDIITVIDLNSKKSNSYSVKQTPVYSILNDGINFDEEQYSIDDLNPKYIKITVSEITPSGNVNITLVFSKYENKKIKNLEGWIIKEANEQKTTVRFFSDSLSVNDKSKVPDTLFE
jgi:hypothetical protein